MQPFKTERRKKNLCFSWMFVLDENVRCYDGVSLKKHTTAGTNAWGLLVPKHPICLYKVYKVIHTSIAHKTAIVVMKAS